MPVTYSGDHDWEKHSTFDIENLFGTNSENDHANNYNHPHETCHSYGGITQNHPFNIQLVYHVRVLYDDPCYYDESNNAPLLFNATSEQIGSAHV